MRPNRSPVAKTLASDLVAGLAGAWAMSQFTRMWNIVLPEHAADSPRPRRFSFSQQEWDATSRMADAVACQVSSRPISDREKQTGALFCHYAVGGAMGVLYAAVANRSPAIKKSFGVIFGASVWLVADELLMPALGISRKLNNYSLLMQANALGEHIAYGVTINALLQVL